jgi:hypothetical protein
LLVASSFATNNRRQLVRRLGPGGDQRSPVGHDLTFPQFDIVLELFDFFFGILRKLGDVCGIWGEWVYNIPIF